LARAVDSHRRRVRQILQGGRAMNVKKGDLAVVIYSDVLNDLGIICNVIGYIGHESDRNGCVHDAWAVKSVGRPFEFRSGMTQHVCAIEDWCLRPISGLPDPEQIDTEQPVNNEVTA
jgi:hypothetical protein